MKVHNLTISKLEGYSGIRLKDGKKLVFKPGINLLVGRNGCGKTNLIRLIQQISLDKDDLRERIESSFLLQRLHECLKKKSGTVEDRFGEITIVEHILNGKKGNLKLNLKNVPREFVAENIMRDATYVQHNIDIIVNSIHVDFRKINSNQHPPKFEMSGYVNSNFLSREPDNQVHIIMEGPIKLVSDFIRRKMTELYGSREFILKMDELEESINKTFQRFLGTTSKEIRINYSDLGSSGRVSLALMDNGNYIQSSGVSTGEAILLNLIFQLTIVKAEGCDILALDEPDSHMHDDMIEVLVGELLEVQRSRPQCIMIIASHSTAFIEKLVTSRSKVLNVITFDGERRVCNSNSDLDLINALHRNGVTFSPLMLSRKRNLFIENYLQTGEYHRDFLLKFFEWGNRPNIIPIGTSGNVQDSDSFGGVFEDILNISKIPAFGIQDGDIWFKDHLKNYLTGKIGLKRLIKILKSHKGAYIRSQVLPNSFYFNFWEIENLYLMEELLPCWVSGNGARLDVKKYHDLLCSKTELISGEYFKTFFKTVGRFRMDKKEVASMLREMDRKYSEIKDLLTNADDLATKMRVLVRALLENDLTRWIPGKEIKSFIGGSGYRFDDSDFNFDQAEVSKDIRKILNR